MTLVLGAFGARLLLYSLLTNPWFSLMVEVLNGITFGIFYATMTSYAHLISPPGQTKLPNQAIITTETAQVLRAQCRVSLGRHSRGLECQRGPCWVESSSR